MIKENPSSANESSKVKTKEEATTGKRISKYLLYAIGEIVLVVVGILIALQINTNIKEARNLALEQTSLENLKEDLIIQKEIIQDQIDHERRMIAQIDSCMVFFDSPMPITEVYRLLSDLTWRRTFVSIRGTYDNMGSTGNFVLISNQQLENAIIRYYKQLDYTASVISNNNLFLVDNHFGNFVVNNELGIRMNESGTIDPNQVLSPEKKFTLSSQLKGRASPSKSNLNLSEKQLQETEKLIQLIEMELRE